VVAYIVFFRFSVSPFPQAKWQLLKRLTASQVGYNNGDGIRYYQHPWSLTSNILYIYTQSNVAVSGRWIYHVGGNNTGT